MKEKTETIPYPFLARFDNRMPLRYRKLWFHLACPQGRIRIIVHSHTDEAASCTAEIYLDKKDSRPAAACTEVCGRKKTENFLKTAENRALTGALIQAGFTSPAACRPVLTPKHSPRPRAVSPAGEHRTAVQSPSGQKEIPLNQEADTGREKSIPAQTAPASSEEKKSVPKAEAFQESGTAEPIPFPISEEIQETEEAAAQLSTESSGHQEASQTAYTNTTPVEEIKKHMSLEDALQTRVPMGICSGRTLEEVRRERFLSLRWYVYGYNGNDNIFRAAAQIVWEASQKEEKAG